MPDQRKVQFMIFLQLTGIKKLIGEEDMEEVDDRIEELERLPQDEDLKNIITFLKLGLYQAALPAIEDYVREFARQENKDLTAAHLRSPGIVWRKK